MISVDFIIIGQGLAGTTLAHVFLQRGQKVLVVDEVREITSSKVAAGVWNPVVFKKYTQSFIAPQLLSFNAQFYPRVEETLSAKFYHPRPYYKVFANDADVQHWKSKLHHPDVEEFLTPDVHTQLDADVYNAPQGSAPILQCGFVDVNEYLSVSAAYFSQSGSLLNETFEYNELETAGEEGIAYKGYAARKVFFCEGLYARQNPWWGQLPFAPVKGEVLTIKADLPEKQAIINKGVFIVPVGNNIYRAGSTYRWDNLDNTPTADALTELVGKLDNLLKVPYEIIAHKAAVRPAVEDRRPLVGLHPQHPHIGIFNGLGSRGVMLAPFFANQLAGYVIEGKELDREVNVSRFAQTITKS